MHILQPIKAVGFVELSETYAGSSFLQCLLECIVREPVCHVLAQFLSYALCDSHSGPQTTEDLASFFWQLMRAPVMQEPDQVHEYGKQPCYGKPHEKQDQ